MPKNDDQRYVPTREDVWMAVGLTDPNPFSGPDDPDPFNISQRPWTEESITTRIARNRGLFDHGKGSVQVGRLLRRDLLRALLDEMVGEGSLIGLPRREWAAMGREDPSRASDILYAHPVLVKMWAEIDHLADELKRSSDR